MAAQCLFRPWDCTALLQVLASLLLAAQAGCSKGDSASSGDASAPGAPPWAIASSEPEPRPGMIWIPPGVLIAGTPLDKLPRVADEEMAGEQVVMRGFYIDAYPYPNEVGAIPTTNISQAEAQTLCESQGKRLCTELELERACKGAQNTTYEYGDVYKPNICMTGNNKTLVPNGFNAGCQSAFGVHDLHGSVWVWTKSPWQRDSTKTNWVALRGGNSIHGELVGRCANGRGIKADSQKPDIGVRCCSGEANSFEVVLSVTRGEPLVWQPPDNRIAPRLEKLVPQDIQDAVRGRRPEDQFKVERMWLWHPLGNEELYVGGGCAHPRGDALCGLIIARMNLDTPLVLAFVASDYWQPTVSETDTPREIFVYGGDRGGAFRKRISYEWGRISSAAKERKRKHKGRREPTYD